MYQEPLFKPKAAWSPMPVSKWPRWKEAKRVCIDTEFRDPTLTKLGLGVGRRKDSYCVGVGYAIEDGPADYLPFDHLTGGNLPKAQVIQYLKDQAAEFEGELVGANLSLDLDVLASLGVFFPKVTWFRDVQIADPCINELHDHYDLEALAQRWGFPGKDERFLREAAAAYGIPAKDVKKNIWRLPGDCVGRYGAQDCRLPLQILRRQERVIDEQNLWGVYNLESQVLPVVSEMRRLGVRINFDRLDRIEAWAKKKETEALQHVKHITGVDIGVGNTDKKVIVARAFRAVGINPLNGLDGKPAINKEWLATIKHPLVPVFLHAKAMAKLRTTFCASVRNHVADDGRVHCTYNQMRKPRDEEGGSVDDSEGAAYGRLSCVHLNLQQQPSRQSYAPAWRAIYEPEEGALWASLDYAAQEPRMVIEYGCRSRLQIGDEAWLSACKARDSYIQDPSTDNHWMMARMIWPGTKDPSQRKAAKEIFLGLSYGMGGAKMCHKLGLPTVWVVFDPDNWGRRYHPDSPEGDRLVQAGAKLVEVAGPEGQALLDSFDAGMPFVRRLAKACEKRAKAVGYVRTIAGRLCHFEKTSTGYQFCHKALNRIAQGGSADQMKLSLVLLHKHGFRILGQIHDEAGLSIFSEKEARQAAELMASSCQMQVPSKVDIEIAGSWGESMLKDKMIDERTVWKEIYGNV